MSRLGWDTAVEGGAVPFLTGFSAAGTGWTLRGLAGGIDVCGATADAVGDCSFERDPRERKKVITAIKTMAVVAKVSAGTHRVLAGGGSAI